ncbi:portal protein [Luteimonas sp. RIT-PG2_3]
MASADRQKLSDEDIEVACQKAFATSLGAPDSDVSKARERNLDFYNAEPVGELGPPEVEDRSDFVATDVSDTVDGMLPQIMRMFVGADDAVLFEGQGQEGSEEQAKLATVFVNHLFYVRNDGVGVIHDWFKDALIQKVGFVKVWADEEADDAKQRYEGQVPEQLAMLMQEGWELESEPEADDEGLLHFTVIKKGRKVCIRVQACPPAHIRVDSNSRWGADPGMIAQCWPRPRYDLTEEGYDLTDVVAAGGAEPSSAMLAELGETDDFSYAVPHPSHEEVDFREVYIKLDRDGDGVAEWLKVCMIDDKIATYEDGSSAIEQVDGHPFVWICPMPRSHAFFGDCPADRAVQPQRLRTRIVRSIDDNMALTVNQRTYVNTSADVNIDDILDNRPGGVIRGSGPAANAIQPIIQPSLGAPAYQFNEFIASWAENRTGFNRYSAGTDQNALNKTARGTELLTAKADMRMELIARFFAVGMKQLFAKMLKLAIQHQNVTEMVAINGRFVPINPGEFRNQFNVKINVGLGTGSKEQQANRILGMMPLIQAGAQAGVVRPQHIAEVIRLYAQALEFKNPEKFVDQEPTGMPPSPEAFQQMQQQVEQQMGQLQQQLQQVGQENEALKAEKRSKDGDLAIQAAKLEQEDRKLTFEEQKAAAELALKADDARRADRDSAVNNAETLRDGNLEGRMDAVEQLLSQIVAMLQPQEVA